MSLSTLVDESLDIALNEWAQVTDHAWNSYLKWWESFSLSKWFAGEFPTFDARTYQIKVGDQFLSIIEEAFQRTAQIPLAVFTRLVAEKIPVPPKLGHKLIKGDDVLRLIFKEVADAGLEATRFNLFPPSYRINKRVNDVLNRFKFISQLDPNSGFAVLKTRILKLAFLILRAMVLAFGTVFVLAVIVHIHQKYQLISEQKELLSLALPQDSKRVRKTLRNYRHRENAVRGPDK